MKFHFFKNCLNTGRGTPYELTGRPLRVAPSASKIRWPLLRAGVQRIIGMILRLQHIPIFTSQSAVLVGSPPNRHAIAGRFECCDIIAGVEIHIGPKGLYIERTIGGQLVNVALKVDAPSPILEERPQHSASGERNTIGIVAAGEKCSREAMTIRPAIVLHLRRRSGADSRLRGWCLGRFDHGARRSGDFSCTCNIGRLGNGNVPTETDFCPTISGDAVLHRQIAGGQQHGCCNQNYDDTKKLVHWNSFLG